MFSNSIYGDLARQEYGLYDRSKEKRGSGLIDTLTNVLTGELAKEAAKQFARSASKEAGSQVVKGVSERLRSGKAPAPGVLAKKIDKKETAFEQLRDVL